MAKIAITGSNGFVGGNIAKVLRLAGHDVIGLVRSPQQKPLPWATTVVDLASIDSIATALHGCDAVVHSAIANDFNRLQEDRAFAYDSYVALTQRVTHAANRAGAQTVYTSSGWVMDGTSHMTPETDCGNPVNFYGVLKALSEQVAMNYSHMGEYYISLTIVPLLKKNLVQDIAVFKLKISIIK